MGKVKSVDEIMDRHNEFLDKCLKECLLTHQKLFELIQHINMHSHLFCKIINTFMNYSSDEELFKEAEEVNNDFEEEEFDTPGQQRNARMRRKGEAIRRTLADNKYQHVFKQFDSKFDEHMRKLLGELDGLKRFENHINMLNNRLDYNGFFM